MESKTWTHVSNFKEMYYPVFGDEVVIEVDYKHIPPPRKNISPYFKYRNWGRPIIQHPRMCHYVSNSLRHVETSQSWPQQDWAEFNAEMPCMDKRAHTNLAEKIFFHSTGNWDISIV